MSRYSAYKSVDDPVSTGGGGRGPHPPQSFGGGGGGGRGDGDDAYSGRERLKTVRLGLYFTLGVILMMFFALSTLAIARRQAGKFDPFTGQFVSTWVSSPLPIKLLLFNTLLLLLSSITAERARRAAAIETILIPVSEIPGVAPIRHASMAWIKATIALGVAFIAGQSLVWMQLRQWAAPLNNPLSSAFIIIISGGHALHLLGGMVVLTYIVFSRKLRRKHESRHIAIDAAAWYWHFMTAVWICLFGVLIAVH